ncbi:hypothetical protein [Nocardia abscessus]|uniref:hypothetical protein n=1 Tax=Nocardia abscessus TaxID=120957 RepID=UPI0012F94C54|nr:hypothetical protein [Nocardia abscessus]MCC3333607.1 hypothetical protein [Nocardia abscessus]
MVGAVSGFAPSGMNKSGSATLSNSYAQVNGWVADTTNYPGSTVSSNALLAQGSKGNATVTATCPWTSSLSCTVTLRLFKNGVQIVQGSGSSGTSGTAIATATGVTVAPGDTITLQAVSTQGSFTSISAGAGTFVRIT